MMLTTIWAQKQEPAVEYDICLLSRDLQTSTPIVHMHKSCLDDDNKFVQTVA